MDYSGLLYKYKINRHLTDEERTYHLKQGKSLNVEPLYQLAVIRANSTYLELVDKYFAWKGFITLFASICMFLMSWAFVGMALFSMRDIQNGSSKLFDELLYLGTFVLMFSPIVMASTWIFFKESFRFTHYPIRLNRKTRMVYVFKLDGSVLSVPWDDVFFTLGKSQTRNVYELLGHVMDADGITVRDTFSLGQYGMLTDEDLANPEKKDGNYLHRYWEFVRRYMEEGPAQLIKQVEFVVPVADKRESIGYSFSRFNANWGPLWIAMLPITLLVWPFRVLAMRTCKVPRWPRDIEEACAVDAGDPYQRDERHPHPNSEK
jgi:hypothetical protein